MKILPDDFNKLMSCRNFTLGFALLCIVLAICTGCGKHSTQVAPSSEQTAQAEAYKGKIELSQLGLARGENYLGDAVYYVQGKIKNAGDKPVQQVELTFKFKSLQNQAASEQIRKALNYKGGGSLAPKSTMDFQVGFEKLPPNWNYSLPDVVVAKVVFR
jgi:hypothetical protein